MIEPKAATRPVKGIGLVIKVTTKNQVNRITI